MSRRCRALIEAIGTFPHERRSVVYSAAGDRRDCDMIRQGQIIAEAFDRVILYEDQYKRGREDGEIMRLLRHGLAAGPRVKEINDYQGASNAVEARFGRPATRRLAVAAGRRDRGHAGLRSRLPG